MDELVPGVDYEPSVCANCGKDEHTNEELQACLRSMMPPPLLDEDGIDWIADQWDDFLRHPNLGYRKDEDTFLFWGSPNDPAPLFIVTWQRSDECLRATGAQYGWHVNGEFVWMDDPFWLHDLASGDPYFCGLNVGGFAYDDGAY